LTGIKPTGHVHLGNLLGSIVPALELQGRYSSYLFIADYHALTMVADPAELRAATREVAATWLALGLDPEKTVLFRQSAVPEVCELAWILGCAMPIGQLERGHAVKSAKEGGQEINVGTWYYPVLMAADILLYDTEVVPIGQDQKQHVEIARDLAIKLNHRFGEGTVVVPTALIRDEVAVVPGLDGRKMSKSYGNEIGLWLSEKQLRKTIMRIVTDSRGVDDVKDPETCNVFALYKLFASPEHVADMRRRYAAPGLGYGTVKQELFELVNAFLEKPREKYQHLVEHPRMIDEILSAGERRARQAADLTLERVRSRVGLTRSVSDPTTSMTIDPLQPNLGNGAGT